MKRTSGCWILSEQRKINKWHKLSDVTGNSSSGFSLGADTNGQGHIYWTVFSECCAPRWGAGRHVCSGRASSLVELSSHIWLSANLGIDGDSFKVHLQWQLSEGLWRVWEHTAEWGRLETLIQLARLSLSAPPAAVGPLICGRGHAWHAGCLHWPLQSEDPDTCFLSVSRTTLTLWLVNVDCACCSGRAEGLRLSGWVQKPCSLLSPRPGLLRWDLGWVASRCSTSQ